MNRVRIRALLGRLLLAAFVPLVPAVPHSNAAETRTSVQPQPPRTLHLPDKPYRYAEVELPAHFKTFAVRRADNTPASNPVTDAGATLGRVLFYDTRLSANNTTACASCHEQKHAFASPQRFNKGFAGKQLDRNAMSLVNLRYYGRGRFFWDERASTLEEQVLMPIQSKTELGQNLPQLIKVLAADKAYPELFRKAFGDNQVTSERIARALAQFLRSLVSHQSRFDEGLARASSVRADFVNFSTQENRGKGLFLRNCAICHMPRGQEATLFMSRPTNNGLDADPRTADGGLGDITLRSFDVGRFKSPSLRNVELTAPYMHDGRFATLEEVIDHYSKGVKRHPNLSGRLRRPRNLDDSQKAALVAFLKTLTDTNFTTDPKFSDPFRVATPVSPRDFFARRGRGPFRGRGRGFGPRLTVDQIVERIMAFDRNKDGKVTRDELPERMQHLIAQGDTNKDGALDREEVKKLASKLASERPFPDFGGRRGRGFPFGGLGGPRGRGFPGDPVERALRDVKLYEEQKKKVEGIRTAHQKKVREHMQKARDGQLDASKVRAERDQLKKELLKEMKAALTGEQFDQFEKALERGLDDRGGRRGFEGGPRRGPFGGGRGRGR
jgi:cytochrome c peroxidase